MSSSIPLRWMLGSGRKKGGRRWRARVDKAGEGMGGARRKGGMKGRVLDRPDRAGWALQDGRVWMGRGETLFLEETVDEFRARMDKGELRISTVSLPFISEGLDSSEVSRGVARRVQTRLAGISRLPALRASPSRGDYVFCGEGKRRDVGLDRVEAGLDHRSSRRCRRGQAGRC